MSIKLMVLETGDTVIGDIKEVMDKEKNEALGYRVEAPYCVDFIPGSTQNLNEEAPNPDEVQKADIGFRFWAPLSADRDFQFTYDFVRVVYEPHESIITSYLDVLGRYQAENTVIIEPDMRETVVTDNPNDQGDPGLMGSPSDFANPNASGEGRNQTVFAGSDATVEDGQLKILTDNESSQPDPNQTNQPVVPE